MRWREAMHRALYGPGGFYARHRPARHFATSAQSPLFAAALARLVQRVDTALGRPGRLDLVDVGAGGGELLSHLLAALPAEVRQRTRPVAVELPGVTPAGDPAIQWTDQVPGEVTGVLLATEWLDNVPLDLAEDGRYLHDGAPLSAEDAAWVRRWWPEPSGIVEIGRSRDEVWTAVAGKVRAGLALAVDYGHLRDTRPSEPTVTGFRDGREVEPRLDGSTDITCHVAMDSAGHAAGSARGIGYRLERQADALRALGVHGGRPPLELAHSAPHDYVRALAQASEAAMLVDPHGLGGHWWLTHHIGITVH